MKRSREPNVIVGLDVGTTKICAIVAEPGPLGGLDVIGVGASPSRGLRKGVVVNIDSTVEAIRRAVGEAEQMAGVEVTAVYAGVAGGHIRGLNSRGVVAVSGKNREVGAGDVERALEAARAINLPQDREIIHVLPQTFVVDDQDGIREPLGMSGVRLEVEVHVVTGAVTSVQNVVRSVNRAGLTVQDIVLEPLASAEAVLSPTRKSWGSSSSTSAAGPPTWPCSGTAPSGTRRSCPSGATISPTTSPSASARPARMPRISRSGTVAR